MKKISACILFSIALLSVHAQGKPDFGIFAGPQISTAKYTILGDKQSVSNKYGFQLGGTMKIPFENRLYFSPMAFYSLKGYKVELSRPSFPPDTLALDNNTTIHTVELAALLQYDFSSKPNHFFLRFGPALDFQLSGREKFNLKNGSAVDRNMIWDFGSYGRYAASAIIQFGYETASGLTLTANYDRGIATINNADGGPKIRHRVFALTVGKYFKKKP